MNARGIAGYRAYLARRDGDADLLNRRLAGREAFFAALEADPVRSEHLVDRRTFARNLRRRKPEPDVDRRMLFLLATAKLNQAERFGVGLGETYGNNSGDDVPPERVYMELEEHYHTRLLAYVLDIFGLPFQVVTPPLVMRQFVKTAVFLPERLSFLFVGAAEMAGCGMFFQVRRSGIVVLAEDAGVGGRSASGGGAGCSWAAPPPGGPPRPHRSLRRAPGAPRASRAPDRASVWQPQAAATRRAG